LSSASQIFSDKQNFYFNNKGNYLNCRFSDYTRDKNSLDVHHGVVMIRLANVCR